MNDLERQAAIHKKRIESGERRTAIFFALAILSLGSAGYGVYQVFWNWEIWFGIKFIGAGLVGGFLFGTIAGYTEADSKGSEAELRKIEIQQGKRKAGLLSRLFRGWSSFD